MRRSGLMKLLACGVASAGATQPARAQNALETLRVIAIPSDALTPLYYGLQNGLFRRAGIDLQIVSATSGTAATTAVIAGAYEVANTSLIPALIAHLRGIPILIVAPQAMYTPEAPFALLQIASDATYKTGADLNGQTVSCAALNDMAQLATSAWVDKTGGDSKTLKFVEIPNTALDAALVQHRVAAGVMIEPLLDESIASGRTKTLADAFSAIAHTFMSAAYVGRADWAKEHADLLRRFVRVALQAATYTNAHPTETASMMADVTKMPLTVMQRMKRVICATTFDPGTVQPVIDVAARYKSIPRAFSAKEIFLEP